MIILAHKGYWLNKNEQNSLNAFKTAFSLGFGIETDIRDYNGEIVISHDIPDKNCIKLEQVFSAYKKFQQDLPLALNIKSNGLQDKLKKSLEKYKIKNYFVFDMSVPDALTYYKGNCVFFTRKSEYEEVPSFYSQAKGVWMDEFVSHWINEKLVSKCVKDGKKICIVSPELHQRNYKKEWPEYKKLEQHLKVQLMICTDHPEKARWFFNA